MKVAVTKEMKDILRVSQMPAVRKIQEQMREDDGLLDYAHIAARVACEENWGFEILKATAEICNNNRVWDAYGEGSGKLDVWLRVYAFNQFYGFLRIGVNLTDIWNVTGDNHDEIRPHMYIERYVRQ